MKKILLSSVIAMLAVTAANAAVSGIASTDYVDNAIGNIEFPQPVDFVADGEMQAVTSNAVYDELVKKADKETTYTKTETDALLDAKYDASKISVAGGSVTIDGTAIATKADISGMATEGNLADKLSKSTEVDNDLSDETDKVVPSTAAVKVALGTKADKETTYTKTETDGLLDAKADKTDLDSLATKDALGALSDRVGTVDENKINKNSIVTINTLVGAHNSQEAKTQVPSAWTVAQDIFRHESELLVKADKETIEAMDSSAGGDGKYITTVTQTDGTVSAVAADIATTVASDNNNLVTSAAVAAALDTKVGTRDVMQEIAPENEKATTAVSANAVTTFVKGKIVSQEKFGNSAPSDNLAASTAAVMDGLNKKANVSLETEAVKVLADKEYKVENLANTCTGNFCVLIGEKDDTGKWIATWKDVVPGI